jgi:hypothetical protein
VVKCLPSKHKALSSNPNTAKTNNKKDRSAAAALATTTMNQNHIARPPRATRETGQRRTGACFPFSKLSAVCLDNVLIMSQNTGHRADPGAWLSLQSLELRKSISREVRTGPWKGGNRGMSNPA